MANCASVKESIKFAQEILSAPSIDIIDIAELMRAVDLVKIRENSLISAKPLIYEIQVNVNGVRKTIRSSTECKEQKHALWFCELLVANFQRTTAKSRQGIKFQPEYAL